jgi:uncharacterized protein (TIRG00374 family)
LGGCTIRKSSPNPQRKIIIPVVLLLLIGVALIVFDRERIISILSEADWKLLPGAMLFIVCANGLVAWSYVILAKLMGIRMKSGGLALVFFTTTVMNRLIRSGGAAGYSLRYLMMKRHGVSLNDVLNSSFLHFLLGSLIMLGSVPLVLVYILVFVEIPAGLAVTLIVLAVIGAILGFGAGSVIFSERLRANAARLAIWLVKKIARRDVASAVNDFANHASGAVLLIRKSPLKFSAIMLLLFGELAANIIALGFCLNAFGAFIYPGGVATVYVLGTLAGVMTALPGGIGVQEGTITSLAVVQGTTFEQSALAAVLFRIVQTVFPYLISIVFYPSLVRGGPTPNDPSDVNI